jgi:hypothetical protein
MLIYTNIYYHMYCTYFRVQQHGKLEPVPQRQLSGRETHRHSATRSRCLYTAKTGRNVRHGFHQNGKDKDCVKKSATDLTLVESTANADPCLISFDPLCW